MVYTQRQALHRCGVATVKISLTVLIKCENDKEFVMRNINEQLVRVNKPHETMFTTSVVYKAIKSLKSGKSCGAEKLASEHLKYAVDTLFVQLTLLFNAMFYIPEEFMTTILVPIIKNKTGSSIG